MNTIPVRRAGMPPAAGAAIAAPAGAGAGSLGGWLAAGGADEVASADGPDGRPEGTAFASPSAGGWLAFASCATGSGAGGGAESSRMRGTPEGSRGGRTLMAPGVGRGVTGGGGTDDVVALLSFGGVDEWTTGTGRTGRGAGRGAETAGVEAGGAAAPEELSSSGRRPSARSRATSSGGIAPTFVAALYASSSPAGGGTVAGGSSRPDIRLAS